MPLLPGTRRSHVSFVAAAVLPIVICAVSALWLLAYGLPNLGQDRTSGVGGMDDLDRLRWNGWNGLVGWPPVTCWQGCADLHCDDWWTRYVYRTCWSGCKDLHREDWWRAYVDQDDPSRERTSGERACESINRWN